MRALNFWLLHCRKSEKDNTVLIKVKTTTKTETNIKITTEATILSNYNALKTVSSIIYKSCERKLKKKIRQIKHANHLLYALTNILRFNSEKY